MTTLHATPAEHFLLVYRDASLNYARKVKQAFAIVNAGGTVCTSWGGRSLDRDAWRAEFLDVLNHRINLKGRTLGDGRKWGLDYKWACVRDQDKLRRIHTQRLRVYQFETAEVRKRFSHRLADPHEI